MRPIERQRRRKGALTWRLYEDVDHPGRVLETYTCATWAEHEHQHQRITAHDRHIERPAIDLLINPPPPVITHLIAVKPRARDHESEES